MRKLLLVSLPVIVLLCCIGCSGHADKAARPAETEALLSFVSSFEKERDVHLTVESGFTSGDCRYYLASFASDKEDFRYVFLISAGRRNGEVIFSKASPDVPVEREHLARGDICSFSSFSVDESFILYGYTDSRDIRIVTSTGSPVHLLDSGIYYIITDEEDILLNVLQGVEPEDD